MPTAYRVLVLDGVSPKGVDRLKAVENLEVVVSKSLSEDELVKQIPDFDAVVVRSQTKVTRKAIEAGKRLKVVGRAGVGVDNVDVTAATEKGVVVMNTPGGNTVSTAEHAFTLMLSTARMIPQAHGSMKAGEWDRKSFQGVEMNNKVLGIIGMGRIGGEVARRAIAFGMRVLAYDPYLAPARARSMQVELFEKLDDMLPHCDFITLHIPYTPETAGILNERTLALCKPSVRIVNCARGGLIDENALLKALQEKKVAAAALDVYEVEPPPADYPLRGMAQLVMTPHLGASTHEAQESVGIEVAESIRDLLATGTVRNAINVPNVDAKTLEILRPYIEFGGRLGLMLAQLAPDRCDQLTVNYSGKIHEFDTTSVTRAVLKGFLRNAGGSDINDVNAPNFAENLGLKIAETKVSEPGDFSELITIRATASDGSVHEVSGTFFGQKPKIVRINGQFLEATPEGVLMIFENQDRPGIVGWIGTLLGKHKVNIASMSLSRSAPGTKALSVLNLDSMPGDDCLKELKSAEEIFNVHFTRL